MPVATALSDGLLTMLTPMVDKVDNGIQQAAESQVALSQQIDVAISRRVTDTSDGTCPTLYAIGFVKHGGLPRYMV